LKSATPVASLETQPNDGNRTRTIIAGIALSLAAVSCVLVFLRKKNGTTQTAASLLLVAGVMFATTEMATADIAPPVADVVDVWENVNQQHVEIQFSDKGDNVLLILGTRRSGGGGQPHDDPDDADDVN
jgi:hypothetical protein